jgi:S-adenosylmethionine:tRNA ribosyltransferase-isomerase
MIPASWPRDDPGATRLLEIDPVHNRLIDRRVGELSALLRKGDLLVVNDAATLPVSGE